MSERCVGRRPLRLQFARFRSLDRVLSATCSHREHSRLWLEAQRLRTYVREFSSWDFGLAPSRVNKRKEQQRVVQQLGWRWCRRWLVQSVQGAGRKYSYSSTANTP